jgi:signal transduction histidine kinase
MAIRSAFLLMLLAGLASGAVLWVFLRREVVSRVEALRTHITTAGQSGKIRQTAITNRDDELSELSKSFNAMADQVNHLRDALADSSYKSGLSEWAAGTLHNVRNGLAPVTAATWQIGQLFDGAWLKNVAAAAAEYADASTPEYRRMKLNSFLVGSATRFGEAAKRAGELSGNITTATKSVLDMVAEFERYAQRKVEMEDVDLLSLIRQNADAVGVMATDIELVLPTEPASVRGNRVILGQIITNLLMNAKEAIGSRGDAGRIEIGISKPHGMRGLTRLTVSDNGEGIAAENLAKIFQRGVSSRNERAGGLGLHWCANAVRMFGGSIRATSPGPGQGATITIDLPSSTDTLKEAA